MRYRLLVKTASSVRDYRWIGEHPQSTNEGEWWLDGFCPENAVSRVSLARRVQPSGQSTTLLTGITGSRRTSASSQTAIRYDLCVVPDPQGPLSSAQVRTLTLLWWNGHNNPPGKAWELGSILDKALEGVAEKQRFGDQDVPLGAKVNKALDLNSTDVARGVSAALASLLPTEPPPSEQYCECIGDQHPNALSVAIGTQSVLVSDIATPEVVAEWREKKRVQQGVCIVVRDSDTCIPRVDQLAAMQSISTGVPATRSLRSSSFFSIGLSIVIVIPGVMSMAAILFTPWVLMGGPLVLVIGGIALVTTRRRCKAL